MNPFNLPGPEFLAVYTVFAALVIVVAWLIWIQLGYRRETPILTNPYEIAYLRGGPVEAVRVAIVGLLERNIVKTGEKFNVQTIDGRMDGVTHPFERRVAEYFLTGRDAESGAKSGDFQEALRPYREKLERAGLLLDDQLRSARARIVGSVLGLLWMVSATKIWLALGRGKSNIGFLILLTVIATIGMLVMFLKSNRTLTGELALDNLRMLTRRTPQVNGSGCELLLWAAVFGAASAPIEANPYVRPNSGGACGSSASSCGSGGGDGGGGGCGGCGGGGD